VTRGNHSTRPHPRLPRAVVALGFVSLCMDASSELVHSLLPVFLVGALGVSARSVGLVEGIAEATAAIGKVFSGTLSDRIGRRKPLVLFGYGLSALTKPLFPLAQGLGLVLAARFVDRIGKGIRGAPRDALVADITPVASRGAAYGLRQSMDTVGAVAGPGLALVLMHATHDDFRLAFWVAVVPAVIAVLLIVFGVQEPETRTDTPPRRRTPIDPDELRRLPAAYWLVVGFATALTLARFSEAFLLLRARSVGLPMTDVPVVLIVMNVVYAASAWPFGQWSDRIDRGRLLALGIAFLLVADVQLAAAPSAAWVLVGALFWGLHLGATQGLLTTLVADAAPMGLRGTAFGLFNLLTGLALLAASVLAGTLWAAIGPAMTFIAGAGFSLLALVGLLAASRRRGSAPPRPA
jgi:MFS family permease